MVPFLLLFQADIHLLSYGADLRLEVAWIMEFYHRLGRSGAGPVLWWDAGRRQLNGFRDMIIRRKTWAPVVVLKSIRYRFASIVKIINVVIPRPIANTIVVGTSIAALVIDI